MHHTRRCEYWLYFLPANTPASNIILEPILSDGLRSTALAMSIATLSACSQQSAPLCCQALAWPPAAPLSPPLGAVRVRPAAAPGASPGQRVPPPDAAERLPSLAERRSCALPLTTPSGRAPPDATVAASPSGALHTSGQAVICVWASHSPAGQKQNTVATNRTVTPTQRNRQNNILKEPVLVKVPPVPDRRARRSGLTGMVATYDGYRARSNSVLTILPHGIGMLVLRAC
jgi:hypothetical protein